MIANWHNKLTSTPNVANETPKQIEKEIPTQQQKVPLKQRVIKELKDEKVAFNFALEPAAVSCDKTDNATIVTLYFNNEIKIINSKFKK